MAATKRQRYPPGPDESVHSWSVRCRVLVFGVRKDTNGDEPRKTTSVLDTDVEETLRHDRNTIVCGVCSVWVEATVARCHQATGYYHRRAYM